MHHDITDKDKGPAPAGMIPGLSPGFSTAAKMPRTCGDDPNEEIETNVPPVNAPHLWG